MKLCKSLLCLTICLAVLTVAACAFAEAGDTQRLILGTSMYSIEVDSSFVSGAMTDEDLEEGQVAYYYSDESLLDFDIYQFGKEDLPADLAEYAAEEAASYEGTTEIVTDGFINGIPVCWYRTVEEYDDAEYDTITYVLDNGDEFVEIVFWLDGEEAQAEADGIIQSLTANDHMVLALGTSPFSIVVPASFEMGEMTAEDLEEDQVGYYYSEDTLLDFDVYQFSKDGLPNDLAEYTEMEASEYDGTSEVVTGETINDIPVAWYRTVEEYEGESYDTITYVLDNDDEFVEIVFWLDGENASGEAGEIINSLSVAEEAGDLIPEAE